MRLDYHKILPTIISLSYLTSRASSFTSKSAPRVFNPQTLSFTSSSSRLHGTSTSTTTDNNNPILPPIPDTAKRLFLVRHGEVIPPGGVHGVFYGALDVPLSPLGELEAEAAATYLQQFDLEHVASSPLKRAIYGAKETMKVQPGQEKEVVIYDGFTELDRGSWCGKTKVEIGEDLMNRFDACDESVTPEGGESYSFLKNRVLQARDDLLSTMSCGKASAVVSHLQVTRSMLR